MTIKQVNATQRVLSKRVSLPKTQKKITTQKNLHHNNTVKNINDKSNYFDELLSNNDILKEYKMMSHIGKGCFSTVSLAISKENNKNYALKTYEKI